ncbi:MAG: nuclease [Legionellales bacterium]|nr:nuclease [Legionellales bacterium]|tara:strand:+ start:6184 stop:6951 length:768 start_codon:yes stop_codon:yes gene_type:complete
MLIAGSISSFDGNHEIVFTSDKPAVYAIFNFFKMCVLRMKSLMSVVIDHREASTEVASLLSSQDDVEVVYDNLQTGDYMIDNRILIERKTLNDLATSISDGRLFSQAQRLSRYVKWKAIILEGKRIRYAILRESLQGALITVTMKFGVPVLWAKDPSETIKLMQFMRNQLHNDAVPIKKRYGRKPKKYNNQALYVLQGLPGIGPERAKQLLLYFGSLREVVNAGIDDLQKISGVGKNTAEKIQKAFRERYVKKYS